MKQIIINFILRELKEIVKDEIDREDLTKGFEEIGVSSFDFVKLLVKCEDEYSFEFADEVLDYHYFESILSLIDYIEKNIDFFTEENRILK